MDRDTPATALDHRIQELARDVVLEGGVVYLPDDKLAYWMRELDKAPEGDREPLATELVALGVKFTRIGGDEAAKAVAQLYALATMLLKDGGLKAILEPLEEAAPATGSAGGGAAGSAMAIWQSIAAPPPEDEDEAAAEG